MFRDANPPHSETGALERALDAAGECVVTLDDAWRFIYLNRQAEHHFGQSRAALRGKPLWWAFPDGMSAPLEAAIFNAGGNWPKAFLEMDAAFLDGMWRVNGMGSLHLRCSLMIPAPCSLRSLT